MVLQRKFVSSKEGNQSSNSLGLPTIFFKNRSILNFKPTYQIHTTPTTKSSVFKFHNEKSLYNDKLTKRMIGSTASNEYFDQQKLHAVNILQSRTKDLKENKTKGPSLNITTSKFLRSNNHNENLQKDYIMKRPNIESTNQEQCLETKRQKKSSPNKYAIRKLDMEFTLRDETFLNDPFLFENIHKPIKNEKPILKQISSPKLNLKETLPKVVNFKLNDSRNSKEITPIKFKQNVPQQSSSIYKTKSISQLMSEIDDRRLTFNKKDYNLVLPKSLNQRFEDIKKLLNDDIPHSITNIQSGNVIPTQSITFGITSSPKFYPVSSTSTCSTINTPQPAASEIVSILDKEKYSITTETVQTPITPRNDFIFSNINSNSDINKKSYPDSNVFNEKITNNPLNASEQKTITAEPLTSNDNLKSSIFGQSSTFKFETALKNDNQCSTTSITTCDPVNKITDNISFNMDSNKLNSSNMFGRQPNVSIPPIKKIENKTSSEQSQNTKPSSNIFAFVRSYDITDSAGSSNNIEKSALSFNRDLHSSDTSDKCNSVVNITMNKPPVSLGETKLGSNNNFSSPVNAKQLPFFTNELYKSPPPNYDYLESLVKSSDKSSLFQFSNSKETPSNIFGQLNNVETKNTPQLPITSPLITNINTGNDSIPNNILNRSSNLPSILSKSDTTTTTKNVNFNATLANVFEFDPNKAESKNDDASSSILNAGQKRIEGSLFGNPSTSNSVLTSTNNNTFIPSTPASIFGQGLHVKSNLLFDSNKNVNNVTKPILENESMAKSSIVNQNNIAFSSSNIELCKDQNIFGIKNTNQNLDFSKSISESKIGDIESKVIFGQNNSSKPIFGSSISTPKVEHSGEALSSTTFGGFNKKIVDKTDDNKKDTVFNKQSSFPTDMFKKAESDNKDNVLSSNEHKADSTSNFKFGQTINDNSSSSIFNKITSLDSNQKLSSNESIGQSNTQTAIFKLPNVSFTQNGGVTESISSPGIFNLNSITKSDEITKKEFFGQNNPTKTTLFTLKASNDRESITSEPVAVFGQKSLNKSDKEIFGQKKSSDSTFASSMLKQNPSYSKETVSSASDEDFDRKNVTKSDSGTKDTFRQDSSSNTIFGSSKICSTTFSKEPVNSSSVSVFGKKEFTKSDNIGTKEIFSQDYSPSTTIFGSSINTPKLSTNFSSNETTVNYGSVFGQKSNNKFDDNQEQNVILKKKNHIPVDCVPKTDTVASFKFGQQTKEVATSKLFDTSSSNQKVNIFKQFSGKNNINPVSSNISNEDFTKTDNLFNSSSSGAQAPLKFTSNNTNNKIDNEKFSFGQISQKSEVFGLTKTISTTNTENVDDYNNTIVNSTSGQNPKTDENIFGKQTFSNINSNASIFNAKDSQITINNDKTSNVRDRIIIKRK